MRKMRYGFAVFAVCAGLLWAWTAGAGLTPAEKCEAEKNTAVGAKAACLAGGKSFDKCSAKFEDAFAKAEAKAGPGVCPTEGDAAIIEARIDDAIANIADALTGVRFIDNGDGTITDTQTGLMWEKKDDDGGLNDKDLTFLWEDEFPDQSIHEWLSELNGHTNVSTSQSGFAGYTDWRIPTVIELQTILGVTEGTCGGASGPCVDPIFNTGCTSSCTVISCSCTAESFYWSSTTLALAPQAAWFVRFDDGGVFENTKSGAFFHVRAVRAGS